MKSLLFSALFILANIPLITFAQQKYEPLVKIPGVTDAGDSTFSEYVSFLYALSISIAALIAVIKIIIAGVKYMLTDVITSKGEAIKDIKGALLGLLIILGAFLILETINPQLTKNNMQFEELPPDPRSVDRASVAPAKAPTDSSADAAKQAAEQKTATGACGTKTDASNSKYTITVVEVGGCSATDEAVHRTALVKECFRKGVIAYSSDKKFISCAIPKTTSVVGTGIVPGSVDSSTCKPAISQTTSGIYTIYSQNLTGCASNNITTYRQSLIDQCNPPGKPTRTTVTGSGVTSSCQIETSRL